MAWTRSVLAASLALLTAVAPAETYNGVTYATSGDIVPGELTSQFSKAKSYADAKNIPLVVVWANPGCGFCSNFERNVLAKDAVLSWMKSRKYVVVFSLGLDSSDGQAAWSYTKTDAYPMCRVHWKKNASGQAVNQIFCGRYARMTSARKKSGDTIAELFMNTVDGLVGSYAGVDAGTTSGGDSSSQTSGTSAATVAKYALTVTASGGGTVSGGGNYRVGVKAYLKATASSGNVFSGWYSGSTLLSQEKSFGYVMTAAATEIVGKFIAKEDDAVEVTCPLASQYTKGVTIDPVTVSVRGNSLPSVRVSGLPTGISYKNGTIGGKPSKSGIYATTVTAKTAGGASLVKTFTIVVSAFGEYCVRAPCDAADGTVAGQGVYAAGKKVTLRMTVKKGAVFEGWYDGTELLSRAKTYAFTMPSDDVTLTPVFITAEEDLASVSLVLGDESLDADEIYEKSATCGVGVSWDLIPGGRSETKVSFSNLPAGLSYDSTQHRLTGAPTASGRYATLMKVKTSAGNVRTFRVAFTIEALPAWAVGNFYGSCEYKGKVGRTMISVSSSGKVSGKLIAAGSAHAISAANLNYYDNGVIVLGPAVSGGRTLSLVLRQEGDLGRMTGNDSNGLSVNVLQNVWDRRDLDVPLFAGGSAVPIVEFSSGMKIKIGQKGAVRIGGKIGKVSLSGESQLVAPCSNGELKGTATACVSLVNSSLSDGYLGTELNLVLSDQDQDGRIETVQQGK